MSYEEKIVVYELRTKILQQAVNNFTSVTHFLAQKKSETREASELKNVHQARIKAISMLLVINALIDDGLKQETILHSNGCFTSSFVTLLCKGKQKFVKHVAQIIKLTQRQINQTVDHQVEKDKFTSNEITYNVFFVMDKIQDKNLEEDQESSFNSISDSLQQADLKDEKDELSEDFQQENEQLQGILVSQSIDCLTAICAFIESEKHKISQARKSKAKDTSKQDKPVDEENKHEEAKQSPQVNQEVNLELQPANVDMVSDEESSQESGQTDQDMSESDEDQRQELNRIGDDYVEDEYDQEGSEEEEEGEDEDEDEDDDDDNEDNDDQDEDSDSGMEDDDVWARRQQRRRQAEAVQDIIDAPQNDRNFDRFGMPIMDVGPQARGMRHDGREVNAVSENWSAEERQVQRTLALLRGMRLNNNESLPRRMNRQGFNPFGALQDRYRQPDPVDPVAEVKQNWRQTSLSDLTSIFAPLSAKDILDFITKAKVAFSSSRKKFVKPKDTSQIEQNICRLIREQRDPRAQFFNRSRAQLIEQLDARLLDAEQWRPFGFLPGLREEEESLLSRYERMLQERARLYNIQESLPSDRFGENQFRLDAELEEFGSSRMNENYRALEQPARNHHLQILQQAVFREVEQIHVEPAQAQVQEQISLRQAQPQQPIHANQRRSSLSGMVAINGAQLEPQVRNQPNQLLQNVEFPELNFARRGSSPRLIVIQPQQEEGKDQQPIIENDQKEQQPRQSSRIIASQQMSEASVIQEQQVQSQALQDQSHNEEVKIDNVQREQEEIKEQVANVEMSEEPHVVQAQPAQVLIAEAEPMTCGIPNSVLLAHDIDPVILVDLPEEIQASVLSEINWQPPVQQQPQQPVQQQQVQQQQIQEEVKEPVQQDPFGIDPGFLASLPPEMRQELLNNESLRNQNLGNPPAQQIQREAEAMDVASIIMTAATPQLRAEMLANLDEATIATLPEALRREAQAVQAANRRQRNRQAQDIDRLFQQAQRNAQRHGDRDRFGNPPPRGMFDFPNMPGFDFGDNPNQQRERARQERFADFKLEKALEAYCRESSYSVFEEPVCIEQQVLQMEQQIVNEDMIVEGVLYLLLKKAKTAANEATKTEENKSSVDPNSEDAGSCKLVQFVQAMTTLKSQKGDMKLINKFINAIALLLKLEVQQITKFRKQLLDEPFDESDIQPGQDQIMTETGEILINTEKVQTKVSSQECYPKEAMTVILTLIGVIRLVARNKDFVSHMLKGLLFREDYFQKKGTSILQLQQEYFKITSMEVQPLLSDVLESLNYLQQTSKQIQKQLGTLNGDEPQLSKMLSDKQAQLRILSHNLQLVAVDTFLEFNQPLVDVINKKDAQKSWKISKHGVQALLQILELQVVDSDPMLLNQLSNTLISLFKKSNDSWQLIFDQCSRKSIETLSEVNVDLLHIELNLLRGNKIVLKKPESGMGTPTKSYLEERKDEVMEHELMLSRQSSQFSDLVRNDSIQDENSIHLKLDQNQENQLRSILVEQKEKITGLKHIFQLFNMIYKEICKKTEKADKEGKEGKEDKKSDENVETKVVENEQSKKILSQIREFYQSREMYEHMRLVNLALQTLTASKIDLVEHIASNLSCIFGAYMPDLQQMIEDSQKNKRRLQINSTGEEKITIKPLDFVVQKSKVLELFKNIDQVNDRLKEFATLCLKNKKAINQYLQLKTRTVTDFSIQDIVKYMPNILNFENKRAYFKKEIDRMKRSAPRDEIRLNVRRNQIFMDAYANLNYRKADIKGKLHITFDGEAGIDAGGVSRDFFTSVSRQMFNPDYSLFKLCSNGVSFYVAQNSFINPDHLQYLKFVGRMIGKALFDGYYMDCYFAKPLYKMILGEDLTFGDLEDLDNEFYQGLKWMLTNDVDEATLFFSVDKEFFDKHEEFDLIPDGRNIAVTNENKLKYIEHRIHFYLYGIVSQQIDALLTGFHELIPKELIRVFNHKELELLISGLPNFDLADLKKHTQLCDGYTNDSPQIVWFWEALQAMDSSEIGQFLQFVTGCSKIPLEGFKNLQGMRGVQQFTIKRQPIRGDDLMRLPQGHTCYNQLDLPEYPTKELLQERLLFAIKETNSIALS